MFNNDARFPTRSQQARAQEKWDVPWGRRERQWTLARSCLRSAHRSFARGGQVVLAQFQNRTQQVSQIPSEARSDIVHRAWYRRSNWNEHGHLALICLSLMGVLVHAQKPPPLRNSDAPSPLKTPPFCSLPIQLFPGTPATPASTSKRPYSYPHLGSQQEYDRYF